MFGLKDFDIDYSHVGDPDSLATTNWGMPGRSTTISLSKNWSVDITDELINTTAFHEVMEVMLVPLRYLCEMRNITVTQIDSEIHTVICRMENTVYARLKDDG